MMNIRKYILLVIAISLFWGCNSEKEENIIRNDKVKVYITASSDLATRSSFEDEVIVVDTEPAQSANTRTELGPVKNETNSGDEQKIYWSDEDSFMMWAAPTGTDTYNSGFTAKVFERDTYNYDFNTADFVTELGSAMDATQKYDYYAVYPITDDPNFGKSGTTVTYNLKTTQSGDYDPAMDVMYATVTNANALVPRDPKQTATNDRVWDEPKLHFKHMLHTLRIWVPAGKNLMDEPIKRLDIVFPGDVVGGTLSFNAANPTDSQSWTGKSKRVTIEFADDDLLDAEGRYVWVYIKPENNLSGPMTFRAYDQNGVPSKAITTTLSNHNFQAQHITPIKLTIPQKLDPVRVEFSCPDEGNYLNFLGETATEMVVKSWPAGIAAAATKLSATDGVFTADFYYDGGDIPVNQELAGATMSAGFKSASADVSDIAYTITLPNMTSSREAHYALPYLFFEDFASVKAMGNNFGGTDDKYYTNDTYSLDGYFSDNGWTGNQITSTAGANIILKCRHEGVGGSYGDYSSRVDSAPISNLINNATIAINFYYSCSYSGNISENYKAYMIYGGTTTSGPIKAYYHTIVALSKNEKNNKVSGKEIKVSEGTGTFNSGTANYSLSASASNQRLSWNIYATGNTTGDGSGVKYLNYNLTLDNIKVSIGDTTKHIDIDKDYRSFFPNHVN